MTTQTQAATLTNMQTDMLNVIQAETQSSTTPGMARPSGKHQSPGASTLVRVVRADYANAKHGLALVQVLDAYALDPMGGGEGLSDFAKVTLVAALAARPQAFSILAFAGADDSTPVGLVNCIEGFSTFACKPLVNVHDVAVLSGYRGQRIGERMLELVQAIAHERGACKLTLEVLSNNTGAIKLYQRVGFGNYALGDAMGNANFMQKWLP